MDTRKGGQRYFPNFKKIVEMKIPLKGYGQVEIRGIPAEKGQIMCGTDAESSKGCGTK